MSFILDALRKSESERRREAAPTLTRAPLATVRRETPPWIWFMLGLLLLALAALGIAWWQDIRPAMPGADTTAPTATTTGPNGTPDTNTETAAVAAPSGAPTAADSPSQAGVSTAAATGAPRSIRELYASNPQLPAWSIEFIAFNTADPAASSVWIDGNRYRPGDPLAEGPEITEIRTDSVVLAFRGERYLLTMR